jgi:hypothetical protein
MPTDPTAPILNPTNQTKTRVIQETVLPCVRLVLIVARPDLHIPTVLHERCLLTVVSQVPVFIFCEHFMSITSIIISACSLWLQLPFQFFHFFFSSIPFLLRLQGKLICGLYQQQLFWQQLERTYSHDDPAGVFTAPQ